MSTATPVAERATSSRTRPRRRRRWPVVLAALYAVPTLAVQVAWWTLGDTAWTSLVNSLTFWWTLPAVPLLLLALLFRSRRTAALLAVPGLLWVWSYSGLWWGSPPAAEGDLRVATYNTYIEAPDLSHVVALAREADPDVLLVQEVLPSQRDVLRDRLGADYPHSWFGDPGRVGGVGLLSRYPIADVEELRKLTPNARPTAIVTLDVDGTRVQVVPVHLTSPCPTCGASLLARQDFEADTRRAEVALIVEHLDRRVPAIVGGDFNSTRRNDPYRLLADVGFRDPQIEAGSGPGFTWPDGSGPFVRIDWVLARGLTPADAWVGPPRGSDHHPVVVDLAFPS